MSTSTSTDDRKATNVGSRAAIDSALDVVLTDAALEPGAVGRFVDPKAVGKTLGGLARHPTRVVRRAGGLGAELARAAVGRSRETPGKRDRRFADPAWTHNWLLHRVLQAYLATATSVDGLITDAELDWRTERRARFTASNVLDAIAPTNFPWSNPSVLKETVDQGGANLARGARRFVRDMSRSPRLPASVDTSKFEVGGNLALTPGAVVLRTDVFELIQYRPTTDEVHEIPLLFVPPTINRYYILDLARGRSLVEHLVAQGQQVFVMSWRKGSLRPRHLRAGGARGEGGPVGDRAAAGGAHQRRCRGPRPRAGHRLPPPRRARQQRRGRRPAAAGQAAPRQPRRPFSTSKALLRPRSPTCRSSQASSSSAATGICGWHRIANLTMPQSSARARPPAMGGGLHRGGRRMRSTHGSETTTGPQVFENSGADQVGGREVAHGARRP